MSNDYSTLSGATAPANGNSVALRIFPAEKPTFKDLRQWLEHGEMVLNQTIYGPALRGETPTHLAHLQVKRDNGITLLTTAQRSAVGPLELARYDQGVAKAIQDEQIRLKQLALGTREYRNKLAALLQSALRPKAGLLLKKLMSAHKCATHGTYDGAAMWASLVKLLDAPSTMPERREHDRSPPTMHVA